MRLRPRTFCKPVRDWARVDRRVSCWRALVLVLVLPVMVAVAMWPERALAGGPQARGAGLAGPGGPTLGEFAVPFAPELGPLLLAPPPTQTPSGGPGATIPVKPTPPTPEPSEEKKKKKKKTTTTTARSSSSPAVRRP